MLTLQELEEILEDKNYYDLTNYVKGQKTLAIKPEEPQPNTQQLGKILISPALCR
jgi:hypothetical protein